jgi:hypothetical protein
MEATAKALPNISEFRDLTHIPYFLAAILLVDVVALFLTRYFPEKVGGESLNDWYDKFGLEGVIADVFVILIGFIIAQYVYSAYIAPTYGWNPMIFVAVLVGVQLVHDLAFYQGVIRQIPPGTNEMMDTYKKYAAENGGLILLGDAFLMMGSAAATFALESSPPFAAVAVAVLTIYTLPYILNTRMQGSYRYKVAAPVKKEEGEAPKEKEVPPRQITPWDMITPQVQSTTPQKIDQGKPMMGQGQMQNDLYNPYSLL